MRSPETLFSRPVARAGRGLTRRIGGGVWLLLLLGLLFLPARALAIGENTGSLGGYVSGQGNERWPGRHSAVAKVQAADRRHAGKVTSDDGSYTFVNLPPGTYELSVKLEGFVPYRQLGIVINAGSRSEVDVALELATSPEMNERTTIVEKNPVLKPRARRQRLRSTTKRLRARPRSARKRAWRSSRQV